MYYGWVITFYYIWDPQQLTLYIYTNNEQDTSKWTMLWTPQSIVTVYSHNSKYFVKLFSHWIYCYNSVDKHLWISKQCYIVFHFTTLYFILQHCECHCRYCDLECRQKIFTSQHNNQLSNTTTARKKLKQTLYSSLQLDWSSNCNLDWDSIQTNLPP